MCLCGWFGYLVFVVWLCDVVLYGGGICVGGWFPDDSVVWTRRGVLLVLLFLGLFSLVCCLLVIWLRFNVIL